MKRAKKTAHKAKEPVERPAVIKPDHARDRLVGTGAAAKRAWSRLTFYEREFKRGSFQCKERCTDASSTQAEALRALERFEAAKAFDEGWQACAARWPGSSGCELVKGGGGGTPGAFVDHQRDVKDYWRRIEAAMGANDWLILRRVCGENYTVAQAVSAISPGYKLSTLARFREALDALVAARGRVRQVRAISNLSSPAERSADSRREGDPGR
jgi:hypothetical protein